MSALHIPAEHQAVMPYLIVPDAKAFLRFIEKVFGAILLSSHLDGEQAIIHAEASISGSTLMFANSTEVYAPVTAGLFIYVKDADSTYSAALSEGAVSLQEPDDKEYGRAAGIRDPQGNVWWITSLAGK
jgi:PhnB protein